MPTFHGQALHSLDPSLWMDPSSPLLHPWISPDPSFCHREGTSQDPPYSNSAPRFPQTPISCATTQMLLSGFKILTFIPKSTNSATSKEQHKVSTALHGSWLWRSFPLNKKSFFLGHRMGLLGHGDGFCPLFALTQDILYSL